jgi:hypothetical protein
MNLLSMKNTIKIFTVCLFVALSVTLKAQFVIPPTLPSVVAPASNLDPTVKEIFKKIEDTLQIKQGDLKPEETKKSQNIAKGFSPIGKDADEQAGAIGNATNANEVKGNINAPG